MRKPLPSLLLIATLLGCTTPFATACGDKLLVLGPGVTFGNIFPSYHASIIAYVPTSLPQSAAVNDSQFQAALQKAGYKLRLVPDVYTLTEAVRSGKYDIILVDLQNAPTAEEQVTTATVNTVVMPVVYDGADLKTAAAMQFRCIRKVSGKNSSCFSTLNKAIESKLKRDELQRRANK